MDKEVQAKVDEISEQLKAALKPYIGSTVTPTIITKLKETFDEYYKDLGYDYEVTADVDPNDSSKVMLKLYPKMIQLDFTITDKGIEI